jgi:hypothetical protein
VKASFVDAKDLQAQAAKVVTERGVVYLMGRVTEREAGRARRGGARKVPGVAKVVRVFEVISEAELAQIQTSHAQAPTRRRRAVHFRRRIRLDVSQRRRPCACTSA